MTEKTILIIDDESDIRQVIRAFLLKAGFRVLEAASGQKGIEAALQDKPDLIILDIMLPDTDGIEVCRLLRTKLTTPVFILSAKDEEIDKLLGLGVGADDYLTKPFSSRELVAKIKAMFRRIEFIQSKPVSQPLDNQGTTSRLVIDELSREVTYDGSKIELTSKEFDLLNFLYKHPHQVFSRDRLLDYVWNEHVPIDTNTVTVHIQKLRDKLKESGVPSLIKTVRGVGYKYDEKSD